MARAAIVVTLLLLGLLSGCAEEFTETSEQAGGTETGSAVFVETTEETQGTTMNLQIGDRRLTATLANNSSAQALADLLAEGPLTIEMRDYGNMEKVGPLGTSLPTNDEQITARPGDLILYQANAFVIYYAPNSWNFTRLGRIDDITEAELREVLGSGAVTVTLSLE